MSKSTRIMTKRMWIVLLACVLVFGGIFGFKWFVSTKITEFFDNMPVPAATVTSAKAKQASWAVTLSAVGTVQAVNGIAITSRASGNIAAIHFKSGQRVKQGDLLLNIDDKEDRASLKALQAAAKLADENYQRYRKLYRRGTVSKSGLDEARSKRDQAKAQVAAQQVRVSYKNITAPFSGQLGIRQVDIGEYVTPGSTLVTLQSLAPIYVNFSLPEQDLPLIHKGLKVRVELDSQPDKQFGGDIYAVEPGVDAATRNFNVQAKFANVDQLMRPGMFASVTIQMPESEQVVVIPRTAIKYNPYGDAVFLIQHSKGKDGKPTTSVISRFVKLGRARGDMVAVVKGLEPGDEVATTGLLKLRNNLSVIIDNSIQPAASLTPHPDNN